MDTGPPRECRGDFIPQEHCFGHFPIRGVMAARLQYACSLILRRGSFDKYILQPTMLHQYTQNNEVPERQLYSQRSGERYHRMCSPLGNLEPFPECI